jgi:hypothetical protein
MNRSELIALAAHRGYPMVSLVARTHRTSPDNKADPIEVKNLVEELRSRLQAEIGKREVVQVLQHVEQAVSEIDWAHTLDGLAIFATGDGARVYYLPFPVESRVVVDETFATRDLVVAWARSERYRVLVLSEKPTRLYQAVRDDLDEIVGHGFPRVHDAPGGATRLPGGAGINAETIRQNHHLNFFRAVDSAIGAIQHSDPQPLVVVGVQRYLGYWDGITNNADAILVKVLGSHDKTPPHELGRLVWPQVREALAAREHARADAVRSAVGQGKGVAGLAQVWRAAAEGRVATLVVDEHFHEPGTVDETGLVLTPAADATAPGVIDDAVDDLVERVLATGGDVVFTAGGLDDLQRIAAAVRY